MVWCFCTDIREKNYASSLEKPTVINFAAQTPKHVTGMKKYMCLI
jgi:hypothetical protein